MSLIYNRNNKGPKIDPSGTPHLIERYSDFTLFRFTNCTLCIT